MTTSAFKCRGPREISAKPLISWGSSKTACLDFFPLEAVCLDHVARFEGLETLEPDATLLAGGHLAHVLLEVVERADLPFEELLFPPEQLCPTAATDFAFDHAAARDDPLLRGLGGPD